MRVVKITAMWCSACLIMNKIWKNVSKDYDFDVVSLDYDMDEEEVMKYKPGDILPVLIFYSGKKEITRIIGEKSEKEFRNILEGIINEKNN